MSFEKQFETLFTLLNESEYDINSPFKKVIKDAVEGSGFCSEPKQVGGFPHNPLESKIKKGANGGVPRGKKLSGYNLFLSGAMKGALYDAKQSMTEAVSLWQNLTQEEKDKWNEKAKNHNEQGDVDAQNPPKKPGKKSAKGKRKPSGYNLFTKAKMVELKENAEIEAKDRLKEIGRQWKELTQEERDEWNVQAKGN